MPESEFLSRVKTSRSSRSSNDAIVLVWNDSDDDIYSKLDSYLTMRKDDNVGFLAQMFQVSSNPDLAKLKGHNPTPLKDVVSTATLRVFFPNGTRIEEPMHDDGLHSDGSSNDGVYGADFIPDVSGAFLVQTVLEGTRNNGQRFVRTAEHSVRIIPRSIELNGEVALSLDFKRRRLIFDIGVETLPVLDSEKDNAGGYRVYFELYGKSIFSRQSVPGMSLKVSLFSSLCACHP